MAEINGTKGILLIDDVAFVAQINNSMAIEKDILDITRKGETRGKIYTGDGEYDTSLDMEILYDDAAAMGVIQAKDKLVNGTRAILKFGQTGAGEVYFQVSGFAKSLTMNFPKNEIAIVPVSFQGTGEVSILNVGVSEILATGNTWVINGNNNDLNVYPFGWNKQYDPVIIYKNGRTFFVFRKSHNSSNGRVGIGMYYNGAISYKFMNEAQTAEIDYHDLPVISIDDDGYIFIFQPNHETTNIDIWKSNNPYDINSFTNYPNRGVGVVYPKIHYLNSKFYCFGRGSGYLAYFNTSNDGVTWGTPVQLAQFATAVAPAENNPRHYPFQLNNAIKDGWIYLHMMQRSTQLDPLATAFTHNYILKTQDFISFSNLSGSYTKNIISNGVLTAAELTNFRFNYAPESLLLGTVPIRYNFIDLDEIIFTRAYSNTNEAYNIFKYDNGWTTINKDLNVSDLFEGVGKYYGLRVQSNVLKLYEYDNEFNETYLMDLYTDQINNITNNARIPRNFQDIPAGQKYAIIINTLKNWDGDSISSLEQNNIIVIEMQKAADTRKPTIGTFLIDPENPDRVYFSSNKPISGVTFAGFTITGKTITGLTILPGLKSGHYFTVNTPFSGGDSATISNSGADNWQDINGNILDLFGAIEINNTIPTNAIVLQDSFAGTTIDTTTKWDLINTYNIFSQNNELRANIAGNSTGQTWEKEFTRLTAKSDYINEGILTIKCDAWLNCSGDWPYEHLVFGIKSKDISNANRNSIIWRIQHNSANILFEGYGATGIAFTQDTGRPPQSSRESYKIEYNFNTQIAKLYYHNGSAWVQLGSNQSINLNGKNLYPFIAATDVHTGAGQSGYMVADELYFTNFLFDELIPTV